MEFKELLQRLGDVSFGSPFQDFIESAVVHYKQSAPAVAAYLDDLYIRVEEEPDKVSLYELRQAAALWVDDINDWDNPHLAQNRIYKLCNKLGIEKRIMHGGMMLDY